MKSPEINTQKLSEGKGECPSQDIKETTDLPQSKNTSSNDYISVKIDPETEASQPHITEQGQPLSRNEIIDTFGQKIDSLTD